MATDRFSLSIGAAAALLMALAASAPARAADETPPLPHQQWSFDGVFGTYDRASLQRGFQVYKQVCSACHPVKHLHFGDLAALGYTPSEIKAIAASDQVTDGPNDQGQMFQRPGRPSDPIPGPFPNDEAARAANDGALPPDLSMIVKARDGGPDYVYALLNGFKPPPAGFKVPPGLYYNEYFPGHQIAMPPPLQRWRGEICRRHQGDGAADGARCRDLPHLGLRAQSRRASSHRGQGDAVSDRRPSASSTRPSARSGRWSTEPPMSASALVPPPVIGIIGGSGLYEIDGLADVAWRRVDSPFGPTSDEFCFGTLDGQPVVFVPRHGRGHVLPPSEINFRANIDALKRCGVTDIVSLSAVGSLREDLAPGDFVVVDQFIDRTFARAEELFRRRLRRPCLDGRSRCAGGSATRSPPRRRRPA